MTRTPAQALSLVQHQSENGPAFAVGMCKRETREAFAVPSDGSGNASTAWTRTDHRVAPNPWIPGTLAWWTGGANGDGHVAILAHEHGYVWSVDIRRDGYWDRVPLGAISLTWPRLTFAGYSRDIDGVPVVPDPAPAPTVPKMPRIEHAIRDLTIARDARRPGPVRKAIRETLQTLRKIKRGEIR